MHSVVCFGCLRLRCCGQFADLVLYGAGLVGCIVAWRWVFVGLFDLFVLVAWFDLVVWIVVGLILG